MRSDPEITNHLRTMRGQKLQDKRRILIVGNYPLTPEGPLTGPLRGTLNLVRALWAAHTSNLLIVLPLRLRQIWSRSLTYHASDPPVARVHLWHFAKLMRSFCPDVMHVSGISYLGAAWTIFARLLRPKMKVFYFAHGLTVPERRFGNPDSRIDRICEWLLLHCSSLILVASPHAEAALQAEYAIPQERIRVLPYPIDSSLLAPLSASTPSVCPRMLIPDAKVILFVGRLVPVKGLEFLLQTLERLHRDDYTLVVIGNWSSHWETLSKKYSRICADRVTRLDVLPQADLRVAFSECDMFVLPSLYEPFGLVAIEAMAAGKPVVVTTQVGMSYLIDSGKNGYVVEFGDIETLRATFAELLDDYEKRRDIGEHAHATIRWQVDTSPAHRYMEFVINAK